MNLQERKQLHKKFMCAALNGLLAQGIPHHPSLTGIEKCKDAAGAALSIADAALQAFEERWKEQERPTYIEDLDFMECDTCRAKPGSPTLCQGCLNNRTAIGRLKERWKGEEESV